jgi:hypothetical protein
MGWVKLTAKIADVPPSAIDWNSPAFLVSPMVVVTGREREGERETAESSWRRRWRRRERRRNF